MNAIAPQSSFMIPTCLDAEQALLGAVLLKPDAIGLISGFLDPSHFSEPLHSEIYGQACKLAAENSLSAITIVAAIGSVQMPEGMTIKAYVARLMAETPNIVGIAHWALMIRNAAHRREIAAACDALRQETISKAITDNPVLDLERFFETTRHIVEAPSPFSQENTSDLAWRMIDEIEKARAGDFKVDSFTTGFEPLDELTRYRPEEVIVTAGRPGSGKSIFSTSAARRIAQTGLGVLSFPLENGREQAIARHLADLAYLDRSPINYSWIMDRDIRDGHVAERVGYAARKFQELPIVVDDAERITIARLGSRVKQEKARFAAKGVRLGVVMIDHLDFISATDRYAGNRVQEIGEIMQGLKALARREKVAVHLFCQLNRGVEGREDKRPQLSDLRNSGEIEQVADVVNFLYREAYYIERSGGFAGNDAETLARYEDVRNTLDVICQKSRTSRVGTIKLFIEPRASFVSGRMR
jgi:replicative DNA helicase